MKIFLDANILFSAAFSNGAIRRLIHDLQGLSYTLVADRYVIEEAYRNISFKSLMLFPPCKEYCNRWRSAPAAEAP